MSADCDHAELAKLQSQGLQAMLDADHDGTLTSATTPSEEDKQAFVNSDNDSVSKIRRDENTKVVAEGEKIPAMRENKEKANDTSLNGIPAVQGNRKRQRTLSDGEYESEPPVKKQLLKSEDLQRITKGRVDSAGSVQEQQQNLSEPSVIDHLLQTGVVGKTEQIHGVHRVHAEVIDTDEAVNLPPGPAQNDYDTGRICFGCDTPNPVANDAKLQCSHWYCKNCLSYIFQAAISTRHPARCCKVDVPVSKARTTLEESVFESYERHLHELSFKLPVYCSSGGCEYSIVGEQVDERRIVSCSKCGTETCLCCRKQSHEGVCELDESVESSRTLAEKGNWSPCPNCSRLVELTQGCYHMKCVCKTEYCYKCGEVWKTCDCPQFDEVMLYDRAAREFDRLHGQAAEHMHHQLTPEEQQTLFNRILKRQREVVMMCTHKGIHRLELPGLCDTCVYAAPKYLMRGCGCGVELCLWCSRIIMSNDGVFFLLRGLRREFFSRWWVKKLTSARREAAWDKTVKERYKLRLARLQALAQQEAPELETGRDLQFRQNLRASHDRKREILRQVGADVEAWERRFNRFMD